MPFSTENRTRDEPLANIALDADRRLRPAGLKPIGSGSLLVSPGKRYNHRFPEKTVSPIQQFAQTIVYDTRKIAS